MNKLNKIISVLAIATLPAWAIAAGDHGDHGAMNAASAPTSGHDMAGMQGMHNEMHASMAGMAGDPAKVSRTIPVEMHDTMRFTPGSVSVKAGETVRFFVVNKGKLPHEMVIGTAEEIDEHAEIMMKMPGHGAQGSEPDHSGPGSARRHRLAIRESGHGDLRLPGARPQGSRDGWDGGGQLTLIPAFV